MKISSANRIYLYKFLVFGFAIMLFTFSYFSNAQQKLTPPTQQVIGEANAPQPAVKHFGYALIDCGYDDPLDQTIKKNYVTEVAAFTNIGHMCVFDSSDVIVSRLDLMSENAMLAFLSVEAIFFHSTPSNSTGSGSKFKLRTDYKARWAQFIQVNNLAQHIDKIGAFYVADEPFWNGLSYDELKIATDTIKASFPTSLTLLIEAYATLPELKVPQSVDLIGFDHYAIPDPESDATFMSEIALLKSKRSAPWQKIVLVMDAQWLPFYGTAGFPEEHMSKVAKSYYNIALSDPDVKALIGYTWPGGLDSAEQKGLRNLPQSVINEHKRIGKLITGK